MKQTHNLIICPDCVQWQKGVRSAEGNKKRVFGCSNCNFHNYLIREECPCGLKEIYCHSCNSDGFTTRPLPREGEERLWHKKYHYLAEYDGVDFSGRICTKEGERLRPENVEKLKAHITINKETMTAVVEWK